MNYRPEYRHEWGNKTYYTHLRLDPLGAVEAQELLAVLLGNDQALSSLRQLILEKTEGNPFFMEEIVQGLLEEHVLVRALGVGAGLRPAPTVKFITDLHIPSTVQAVLASRIDRLPAEEKELLQTLAVIGKEFSFSLLARVVNKPAEHLHGLLAHLQAGEFIYEQPAFPEPDYVFKHALTVAYNSLLMERRRLLHERAAQAIEDLFHSRLEDHYNELAHRALGATLCSLGELAPARAHLEQSLALYDSQQHRADDILYGQAPVMLGFGYLAWTLWILGYPAQALEKTHAMFTLTQELSRPISLVAALGCALRLHLYRRERHAAQECAEALITLCTEHGFPYFMGWGIFVRGWAEQRQGEGGIAQMRQGIADDTTVSGGIWTQLFLALLAEVYGKAAQVEEGLNLLAEALARVDKTGERYYEAELYRLRGTLMHQSKTSKQQAEGKSKTGQDESEATNTQHLTSSPQAEAEAEACFHKAIEIARHQQAKSLELRAVMSLARLWQRQGKRDEARQMLAEIYGWFTEGFDTADLQEAQTLLEELK